MMLFQPRMSGRVIAVALAACAVLSPFVAGGQVDAAKHKQHGRHHKPPVAQDDVSI